MNLSSDSAKTYMSPSFRWVVLILISIVIGTNYYVYDAMSSIKGVMQSELGFTNTQYGLIVAFYAFPNTFFLMTIFGGMVLDKWGIRKVGLLFVTLCAMGAFVTAYGASDYFTSDNPLYGLFDSFLPDYSPQLKMMMLGRLLYGLGAETSILVINKVLVKWFPKNELSRAFALNVSVARLGTAAALIISPTFVDTSGGWADALWLATVLMGIGLVFFIIYSFFDSKVETKETAPSAEDEFHARDIFGLLKNRSFLFIILLCVTFYSAVFPFQAYCPDLLHNKFGVSIEMSGVLTSLIIWGTIIFTPLFGWLVDKKGMRASLMILGSFLLIIAHLILSLTNLSPYISMFIIGIAFSLVPAAMWPAVALIVKEKVLGTAYGVMASLQNLGLFSVPILAGMILDDMNPGITPKMVEAGLATYDYTFTILMFAGLGILGLIFSFLLKRVETGPNGHGLEKAG